MRLKITSEIYAIRIRLGSECRDDDEDWAMSIGQKTNTRKYSVHFRMIVWQNICFYATPLCVSVFLFSLSLLLSRYIFFRWRSFKSNFRRRQPMTTNNFDRYTELNGRVVANAIKYTAKRKANFASTTECASPWRTFPIGRNQKCVSHK